MDRRYLEVAQSLTSSLWTLVSVTSSVSQQTDDQIRLCIGQNNLVSIIQCHHVNFRCESERQRKVYSRFTLIMVIHSFVVAHVVVDEENGTMIESFNLTPHSPPFNPLFVRSKPKERKEWFIGCFQGVVDSDRFGTEISSLLESPFRSKKRKLHRLIDFTGGMERLFRSSPLHRHG